MGRSVNELDGDMLSRFCVVCVVVCVVVGGETFNASSLLLFTFNSIGRVTIVETVSSAIKRGVNKGI